jgi:hypothetical protein
MLLELLLMKLYSTDAPLEERSEPMAPQDSRAAPLALTLSTAGCVGLGDGFFVGLGLGFGEGFGVDPVDDGTDPAAVVGARVAGLWVVGCELGRLEEPGEVRAADGDAWEVAA